MTGARRHLERSRIVAFDVGAPASIALASELVVPGEVQSASIVGDVLYVASYEDGACDGCTKGSRAVVRSIDLATPSALAMIGELGYAVPSYFSALVVHWSAGRAFLGFADVIGDTGGTSIIHSVDLSDPGGALLGGAWLRLPERVTQMSEHAGVLRVLTKPYYGAPGRPTSLFTYGLVSTSQLDLLAELSLTADEEWTAVFDGTRAYLERSSYTTGSVAVHGVDLSNPASLALGAALPLQGRLLELSPQGDRLVVLSRDDASASSQLGVALYDVTDVAQSSELSALSFAGASAWWGCSYEWRQPCEPMHVSPADGLILVPHAERGLQLIDWAGDALLLRGALSTRSAPRRAWIESGRLLALNVDELQSAAIVDRDAPTSTASLPLRMDVLRTIVVGAHLARIVGREPESDLRLQITTLAQAESPEALSEVDLDAAIRAAIPELSSAISFAPTELLSFGEQLYLLQPWRVDPTGTSDTRELVVAVFDIADPTRPLLRSARRIEGIDGVETFFDAGSDAAYDCSSVSGWALAGTRVLQQGSTLMLRARGYIPGERRALSELIVIELADPNQPEISAKIPLPPAGGGGRLHASAGRLYTSHWESVLGGVQFYVDVVDRLDPQGPSRISTPIPGALLGVDPASGRLLTMQFEVVDLEGLTYEQCGQRFTWATRIGFLGSYGQVPGTCRGLRREVNLVELDGAEASIVATAELLDELHIANVAFTEGQLLLLGTIENGGSFADDERQLLTLSERLDEATQSYALSRRELALGNAIDPYYGFSHVRRCESFLRGDSALLTSGSLALLAPAEVNALGALALAAEPLSLGLRVDLFGYAQHIAVRDNAAYVALGRRGLQRIDLSPLAN